ncbi:hypothetical protein JY472_01485 [Stenotrophomonas maltophilia]|nr:hypothetical protein [Stenotrophomonas maltophilia]
MTRSEWKQAWRYARNYRRHAAHFVVRSRSYSLAISALFGREARSAELGLSLSPTSDK